MYSLWAVSSAALPSLGASKASVKPHTARTPAVKMSAFRTISEDTDFPLEVPAEGGV
jgi:hypothetical protein